MKLSTSFRLENILVLVTLISSMTLAFGYMKADIKALRHQVELKANEELITFKLDVMQKDINEIKLILKQRNK